MREYIEITEPDQQMEALKKAAYENCIMIGLTGKLSAVTCITPDNIFEIRSGDDHKVLSEAEMSDFLHTSFVSILVLKEHMWHFIYSEDFMQPNSDKDIVLRMQDGSYGLGKVTSVSGNTVTLARNGQSSEYNLIFAERWAYMEELLRV